jgi:hypothetical protein
MRRWLRTPLCLLASLPATAVPQVPSEYQLKMELIPKFTRFVEWPNQSPVRNPYAPFILGVIGHSPFGDDLDRYFQKQTLKGKGVQIRYCRTLEDLDTCDLVFICASEKDRLKPILARVRQKPILTVSDSPGFAKAGVMVSFLREGNRLAFEVNAATAKEAGIQFGSSFLQVVRIVAS